MDIHLKEEFDIKIEQDEIICNEHGINFDEGCKLEENKSYENENLKDVRWVPKEEIDQSKLVEEDDIETTSEHDEYKSQQYSRDSDEEWSPLKKSIRKNKRENNKKPTKLIETSPKNFMNKTKNKKQHSNEILIRNSKRENLTCPYCGSTASFLGNLKRHIKEIHVKQDIFMCRFCKYQSSRRSHLNMHINTKHTKETKYKCTFCEFEALSPNILRNHINHIHTLHRWYNCEFCDFKTTHSGNLKVHIQGKHNESKKLLRCKQCDFTAEKKFRLSMHIDQVHEREKLKCSFCSHVSKIRSQLGKHIRREHPEQAKHKCEICEYKGLTPWNLKSHVISKHHVHQISYKCDDCDASYECFASLKKHRNIKHT